MRFICFTKIEFDRGYSTLNVLILAEYSMQWTLMQIFVAVSSVMNLNSLLPFMEVDKILEVLLLEVIVWNAETC